MATPPSLLHGSSHPRTIAATLSLVGLAMLHTWELPQLAAHHGGFAFFAAWAACVLVLGLPLLLLELMLGRRSRRSPLEGLAFLTREADVPRGWRVPAWASAMATALALAALALLAGNMHFLGRELELVEGAVQVVSSSGLVLPLGTGALLVLAAGLSLLSAPRRSLFTAAAMLLVLLLLLLAAVAGSGAAVSVYTATGLALTDWQQALRLALLSLGGGLGLIWVGGMQLAKEKSLARLALSAVAAHIALALLLMLALAPFVAAQLANAHVPIVPTGSTVGIVLSALALVALLAMLLLAEPLLFWLAEKGMARLPAVVGVFGTAAVLAEGLWFFAPIDGLQVLLKVLGILLLLTLFGFSVFAGWAMKISHARKELALPDEVLYNLWRVAVRIALPLAIIWALMASFP